MTDYKEEVKCTSCSGTGIVPSGGGTIQCSVCQGTGKEITATVEGADEIAALSVKLDEMFDYLKKILEIIEKQKPL